MRITKRRLVEQWPDALSFLAAGLKAGLSLEETIAALQKEAPDPLKSYLSGILGKESQWVPLEQRLEILFSHPALRLAKAALQLSHESGGKVVMLLEKASEVIREKQDMEQKFAVMTAHGRLSAWIVGLSPFVMAAFFGVTSPDYVRPLITTRMGLGLLGISILMVGVGLYFVHRVSRPERG